MSDRDSADSTNDVVAVGYIARAHGIRGDVFIKSLSDDPDRFTPGASFGTSSSVRPRITMASVSPHKDGFVVALEGVHDRTTAEALAKSTLTVTAGERRQLDDDEFWPDELTGLPAVHVDGTDLGTVDGVVFGASQDRLSVATPDGTTVEVPFVAAIVVEVTADGVTIDPPSGLFASLEGE